MAAGDLQRSRTSRLAFAALDFDGDDTLLTRLVTAASQFIQTGSTAPSRRSLISRREMAMAAQSSSWRMRR